MLSPNWDAFGEPGVVVRSFQRKYNGQSLFISPQVSSNILTTSAEKREKKIRLYENQITRTISAQLKKQNRWFMTRWIYGVHPNTGHISVVHLLYLPCDVCISSTEHVGCIGIISALGLDSADQAQRSPHRKDGRLMLSRYGPRQSLVNNKFITCLCNWRGTDSKVTWSITQKILERQLIRRSDWSILVMGPRNTKEATKT